MTVYSLKIPQIVFVGAFALGTGLAIIIGTIFYMVSGFNDGFGLLAFAAGMLGTIGDSKQYWVGKDESDAD